MTSDSAGITGDEGGGMAKDLLKDLDGDLDAVERKAQALLDHASEQMKAARGVLNAISKVRELAGTTGKDKDGEQQPGA